jgi:proteasome lid subunit RPN8/RPN11
MIVHLSDTAFMSVVLSSIEAYKKECYGLLLGHRTARQWRVEYAIPSQTATRGHSNVTPHGLRDRRVRACLPQLCDFEVLGTFHSHPAWGRFRALAKPSPTDLSTLLPGELDLIIAVNDARRQRRWTNCDNGRALAGTVNSFSLKLAAFYKPPIRDYSLDSPVRRTLLRCPYAIGFEPDVAPK